MTGKDVQLIKARSMADIEAVQTLFRQYAAAIGVDLAYQGFGEELAGLPGAYAPPTGEVILAQNGRGDYVGCVAVRPLPEKGVCEMKRLFVMPEGQSLGLGRRLAEAIIETALALGYQEMRLDTLPTMGPAIALYRSLGFTEMEAYYDTPIGRTVFMRCSLS